MQDGVQVIAYKGLGLAYENQAEGEKANGQINKQGCRRRVRGRACGGWWVVGGGGAGCQWVGESDQD